MDLIKRNFCHFTFPVEQVQTVYRLLVRADPSALEWLREGFKNSSSID